MPAKNVYQRRKPRKKLTRAERNRRITENLFKGYVKLCAQRLSREDMLLIVNQHFDEAFVAATMEI